MKCPKCETTTLVPGTVSEVHVDRCPDCGGVWLDAGELDQLSSREWTEIRPLLGRGADEGLNPKSCDVPAEVGLARARKRRGQQAADRFEAESLAAHQELREAYRALAHDEPARCVMIDATEPKAAVADRIWKTVSERLLPAAAPGLLTVAAS